MICLGIRGRKKGTAVGGNDELARGRGEPFRDDKTVWGDPTS